MIAFFACLVLLLSAFFYFYCGYMIFTAAILSYMKTTAKIGKKLTLPISKTAENTHVIDPERSV